MMPGLFALMQVLAKARDRVTRAFWLSSMVLRCSSRGMSRVGP